MSSRLNGRHMLLYPVVDLGLLLVLMLASFRLTRLITRDSITADLRSKVPETFKLDELVHCDWCAGVWVSAVVVGVADLFADFPLPIAVWGAAAGAVGLLASWER